MGVSGFWLGSGERLRSGRSPRVLAVVRMPPCYYGALAYNSDMTLCGHIFPFEAARTATAGRWL